MYDIFKSVHLIWINTNKGVKTGQIVHAFKEHSYIGSTRTHLVFNSLLEQGEVS